jgi:thiol-disulfide isomerase/thioredoxin
MKIFLIAMLLLWVAIAPFEEAVADESKLVYTADAYDPKRDADEDLEASKKMAARDGRHILLLVGGDWCPWCRKLAKYIEDNEAVSALLASGYVIQKVLVDDDVSNSPFLNPYPAIPAYPHVFLLDARGELLHSLDTEPLEKSGSYDEVKLLAILKQYAPRKDK